jgi:hypothetical protein
VGQNNLGLSAWQACLNLGKDGKVTPSRERKESNMNQHLTPAVVRQFGVAFGLWACNLDSALLGRPQAGNPDLSSVEESAVYLAVLEMINQQDSPQVVKKEVAGVWVYVEEKPSALYQAMREAMFEGYRQAALQS